MADDFKDLLARRIRERLRLRLGPNALAMAQAGADIMLNSGEADQVTDTVLEVLAELGLTTPDEMPVVDPDVSEDVPPIEEDPVAIALGFVDPPENMTDELRERVETLKRRGLRQRYAEALAAKFTEPRYPDRARVPPPSGGG